MARVLVGSVAETIDTLVKNDISLDKCIYTIADLFSDSEDEFEKKKNDLRVLRVFTESVKRRDEICKYVSVSEITNDRAVEAARSSVLEAVGSDSNAEAVLESGRIEPLWANFKNLYTIHYVAKHDAVATAVGSGDTLKTILGSETWAAFESFSSIPSFDQRYISKARQLIREMRQMYCDSNIREALMSSPFCTCSFSLSEFDRLIDISDDLRRTVASGLDAFRDQLTENGELLILAAESDAMAASCREILAKIADEKEFLQMPSQSVRILKLASTRLIETQIDGFESPTLRADHIRESVDDEFQEWDHQRRDRQILVNN